MDENTLTDLKQFISSTVGQQITESESRLTAKITSLDQKLSGMISELSDNVAEALSSSNEATEEILKDHELRITKLETA